MTLHKRETTHDRLLDSMFAGVDLSKCLPSQRFPEREMRPTDAFQAISDELLLDGNARQNLATFCQTWEEPEIHLLMDLCIDKNMIDKDEYPQTAELERRCVHMLADLWNAPEGGTPVGCSAIGSSEACMLGGMAAKWRWRAKREAAGKPTDKPNMVCGPVQVVWHKFAKYWDIEMREMPMAPGRYAMDVEQMLEQVDENTIMVVPTFGVTYTGSYEPVLELAQALDKLQEDTGLDIDIHVDGASGAFLAPFCAPDVLWDFRVPRVKSISTSGHKFGLAPLGVGWVIWRDAGRPTRRPHLPRDLPGRGHARVPDQLLEAGRPDRGPVLQLRPPGEGRLPGRPRLVLRHRTVPGRRDRQARARSSCCATGIRRPGIPAVAWRIRRVRTPATPSTTSPTASGCRGWQVPAYPLTGSVSDIAVQRILVRQGVSLDMATLLLGDIKLSIDHFAKHPVSVAMTKEEAGGFSHL